MRHSFHHFANRVRHQGVAMWRTARHYGTLIDRHVQTATHLYGNAVQPALRGMGYDTREVDRHLHSAHGLYSSYKESLNDGVDVVDGIAANLRGGTFSYR